MQTIPTFAYLVPILFFFGFGPVAALVATIIYAMPPMARNTTLALRGVSSDVYDFGKMIGCSQRQMTWRVLIPSAKSGLMIGVNQVIMLSLNMVIIASMIGAGGLGFDVLESLRRLDIGRGLEAGIAIVVLAVALDRISQAYAEKQPTQTQPKPNHNFLKRWPTASLIVFLIIVTGLVGFVIESVQTFPESAQVSTAPFWDWLISWINLNFFDALESFKVFFLQTFMLPLKRFLAAVPWWWWITTIGFAGWRLGRERLSLLVVSLSVFVLVVGLWDVAIYTIYLCASAVVVAMIIGVPLGVLAAEHPRFGRAVGLVIDTLQTLPSFVYLIPVVMLFRVGDFTAFIAVVLYALAPAVRYTWFGIRELDDQIIEAATVSGCTRRQLLTRVKLPLALPEILLGLNQTIMLALSMLVITALVGTRDLGQEVYIALTKANTGRGIVAGLSIAAIAIIADRLIGAAAKGARERYGINR
jgi:glycine betaine/proline transport system permease protein